MDISIFEIIGPVMLGPSSSGTGGMARLGKAAYQFLDAPLKSIDIKFHPRFHHYPGLRSHVALIGGLMGMTPHDPALRDALEIAKEQGIECTGSWFTPPYPDDAHAVLLTLEQVDGQRRQIFGASTGGGMIDIYSVDGFDVQLLCTEEYLFVWAEQDISAALKGCLPRQAQLSCVEKEGKYLFYAGVSQFDKETLLHAVHSLDGVKKAIITNAFLEYGFIPHEPLFTTCKELMELSEKTGKDIPELAIEYEIERSGRSREEIWNAMSQCLHYMKECAAGGITSERSTLFGLGGGDAKRIQDAVTAGKTLGGSTLGRAMAKAVGVMETGMSMNRVVAAPTGGSAGIVPGAFITVQEDTGCSDEELVKALLTASAMGVIMFYHKASFSGQGGGCQGEIGVSSAIAAAGLAYLGGGDTKVCCEAMALALKNMLGLICDPIGGCTEVPCIKRNGVGVANAFVGCDMALAGIVSRVEPDHVIEALCNTQKHLPASLRGGAGGLCSVPESKEYEENTKKINKDMMLKPSGGTDGAAV